MTANHIKRIEIENFLSFKGKTTVEFHRGLNVITGPSAGGKSNLLRAIFYGYLGIAAFSYWDTSSHEGEPAVRCTPNTKSLVAAARAADILHRHDGLFMSREARATLALKALIESKIPWSELCTGFRQHVQQLSPSLAKVELKAAPVSHYLAFVPPKMGEASLSSGQKYVLTLSYVLALTLHTPGPLILDDFGMCLDKQHSERAARLLRQISKTKQVIIVTCNDYVLGEADRLFGVSWNHKKKCSEVTVLDV